MRKYVRLVRLCLVAFFLAVFSGIVLTQEEEPEKKYRIYCGGLDIMHTLARSPELTPSYRLSSINRIEVQRFDLTNGLIVPVTIRNYGKAPLTIRTNSSSWKDFVGVEVKYVLNEEEGILEDPSSAYTAEFYTRIGEEKDVLPIESTATENDYDEIWFIVEFSNPEPLKEGKYVLKPVVDFDALGIAITDLSSDNLAEVPSFEQVPGAHFCNWVNHKRTDIGIIEQAKEAINNYLHAAIERFEFEKEEEARQFLNSALIINSESVPTKITLAGIDYETSRFQEALIILLQVEVTIEGNGDPYYTTDDKHRAIDLQRLYEWIGYCYHNLEDYANAESFYLLSLEKLKEPAFSPGPDIDQGVGRLRSNLCGYLRSARNQEP